MKNQMYRYITPIVSASSRERVLAFKDMIINGKKSSRLGQAIKAKHKLSCSHCGESVMRVYKMDRVECGVCKAKRHNVSAIKRYELSRGIPKNRK